MDHAPARRKRVAALAAWLVLAAYGAPQAHEGDPRVWRIEFPSPDQAQAWVVDEMGLLLQRPDGFVWLCDDALSLTAGLRAAAPVSADGQTWLTATREAVYRSADGGCSFEPVGAPLAGHFIGVTLPHPGVPAEVLVATASLAQPNDVFRTTDGGLTWRGAGLALSGPVRSLIRAPSDPAVVYLSHADGAARSDDGGQHFVPMPIGPPDRAPRADEFRLLAVSPDDPATVYAALEQFPDGHLAVSRDGGASWAVVLTVPGDVPESLAVAPGGRLWVSTPFTGLWRSQDAGASWDTVTPPGTLGCLTVHPQSGELWGCLRGNPLPWVVGRSADGGESWTPALAAYAAIAGGLACPAASPTGQICSAQCDPADRACGQAVDAGVDGADGGADGGAGGAEASRARPSGGCQSAQGAGPGPGLFGLFALLGLWACDRRRRGGIQPP